MGKHYYLYIDDSGSRNPDKKEPVRADGMNCFALGGILVDEVEKVVLEEKYRQFCQRWDITYPLHSTKIRGRRDDFSWLETSSKVDDKFLADLEDMLVSIPAIGFAVVIDRDGYNGRYRGMYGDKRWLMCKTAYSILIERVSKYVDKQEATFEVCFEEVGKIEDRAIIQYGKDFKISGLPFSKETSSKYSSLEAEDFKRLFLGDARRKTKKSLYIQFADLYLYPMVKRKYDESYRPWNVLFNMGKVIDSLLLPEEVSLQGIKYSCFDTQESKNPE